jgi:hypothetical protein
MNKNEKTQEKISASLKLVEEDGNNRTSKVREVIVFANVLCIEKISLSLPDFVR